jgi:hypothetical protein
MHSTGPIVHEQGMKDDNAVRIDEVIERSSADRVHDKTVHQETKEANADEGNFMNTSSMII